MSAEKRDFIQIHGVLRGERVTTPSGVAWALHDFVADDGAEFAVASPLTSTVAIALPKKPPEPKPPKLHVV